MSLSPVLNLKLHNQIDRVLHVPGNYSGGILEMAIVIDCSFSVDTISAFTRDIVLSCKRYSEVFRNVRLNIIRWDEYNISSEIASLAVLQIGSYFDQYEEGKSEKANGLFEILDYLKRFQARSKLVLFLTEKEELFDEIQTPDEKGKIIDCLNPFLKNKLIVMSPNEIQSGGDIYRKLILNTK